MASTNVMHHTDSGSAFQVRACNDSECLAIGKQLNANDPYVAGDVCIFLTPHQLVMLSAAILERIAEINAVDAAVEVAA